MVAVTPLPESPTAWDAINAVPFHADIVIEPVAAPVAVGVNVIAILQLVPPDNNTPLHPVAEKGAAGPEVVIVTAVENPFDTLTYIGTLVVFTTWSPKAMLLGENHTPPPEPVGELTVKFTPLLKGVLLVESQALTVIWCEPAFNELGKVAAISFVLLTVIAAVEL